MRPTLIRRTPICWTRTMTRSTHAVVLALLLVAGAGFAQHAPGDGAPLLPSPAFELGGHARVFADAGDLSGMLEYLTRFETDRMVDNGEEFLYHALAAGGYYRLHRNVKVGAFYRLQFGARHDEDWIETDGQWLWRDTAGRAEHVFMADATPRLLLRFLPEESWVLAVKNRYELTVFTQDAERTMLHSLLVRPGLTYFHLRDREPVFNASLQYATYWSLSFGEVPWYRHGPYVNLLYHLRSGLSVDLSLGRQWIYWSESADFDAAWPNNTYAEQIHRAWTVDAGVIYRHR